jgi:hypothetical protein
VGAALVARSVDTLLIERVRCGILLWEPLH